MIGSEDARIFYHGAQMYLLDHRIPCTKGCSRIQPSLSQVVMQGKFMNAQRVATCRFLSHLVAPPLSSSEEKTGEDVSEKTSSSERNTNSSSNSIKKTTSEERICRATEKNWMPFSYGNQLYMSRTIQPHRVVRVSTTFAKTDSPRSFFSSSSGAQHQASSTAEVVEAFETSWSDPSGVLGYGRGSSIRGGTPYVPVFYNGKRYYLGIVHTEHKRRYRNFPILVDGEPPFPVRMLSNRTLPLRCTRLIPVPRVGSRVCFAAGLLMQKNKVYVSYGAGDAFSFVWNQEFKAFMEIHFGREAHVNERSGDNYTLGKKDAVGGGTNSKTAA